jgi:hypothetical protein
MDWLAPHSPMTVDWAQKWMSVPHHGGKATLSGIYEGEVAYTLCELSALLSDDLPPVHPEVQPILEEFATVFDSPTGLPPRRQYDHVIPLIPGARPVSIQPYRVVPAMKSEIEK